MEQSRRFPDTLTDEVDNFAPNAAKRDTDRKNPNGGAKAMFVLQKHGSGYYGSIRAGVNEA